MGTNKHRPIEHLHDSSRVSNCSLMEKLSTSTAPGRGPNKPEVGDVARTSLLQVSAKT